jgi:outer membrane protein insertion porin family
MRRVVAALLLLFALQPSFVFALDAFVIKDIRVEGVQRISAGTVFNYLPLKVGDSFTQARGQDAIRALYKTGFFKDIQLEREGDVLVVKVTERPAIAKIDITGAKEIPKDDLKKGLREVGFVEGRVFNRSLLEQIEQELRRQYFARGRYAVGIKPTVTPLERNRVDVTIAISEGRTARIQEINIVGNERFSDKELRKLFTLQTKAGLFGKKNQYSRQKLVGDLERLRNYYQDRGYLEFDIASTQVAVTPDKEQIYITVNLTEGKKYTVSDVKLAGKLPLPKEQLAQLITITPGDVFSRKRVTEATKSITDRLGNEGYAFANVNAIPDVNKEKASVAFTFFVDVGKRVYVRRINFFGNVSTRDNVLRREMRQLEGAWFSTEKVQRSRERLQRTGFFDDVTIETPPVPGSPDQVDINVTVKERLTGNLLFGVGFGDGQIILSGSITESNLFGTGKEFSATLNTSKSNRLLNLRYVNPYWTKSGISRGFRLFYQDINTETTNVGQYQTDTGGGGVFFGFPISESRRIRLGFDLERTNITTNEDSSQVSQDFVAQNGNLNTVLKVTLGWAQDTTNAAFFPTKGGIQSITGEITTPGSDLQYYKLSWLGARYWPTTRNTSVRLKGELGVGGGYSDTDELPFYENFYAGGATTVRGYAARTLGPRDTAPPNDPIGGDKRLLGNTEWSFPVPGQSQNKSMRMSLFVDTGWVWGPGQSVDLSELRYSTGLAFNWLSPVGPLTIILAKALNAQPGDDTETVQFTLGAALR